MEMVDVFLEINMQAEKEKRIQTRLEEIKYEFRLYNCFCKLFGLKACDPGSFKLFNTYCEEKGIKLL